MNVNMVPKDGGNKFSVYFGTNYTNKALQADNLDDVRIPAHRERLFRSNLNAESDGW